MDKELKFYSKMLIGICAIFYSLSIFISQNKILEFRNPFFMVIYGVAGYSPSLAAILTIKKYHDDKTFKSFIKNIINMKQSLFMYLYTLLSPIVLWVSAYIFHRIQGDSLFILQRPIYSFVWLIPVMIIGGGLEEIGWRGYLLPKLCEKHSLFVSTLIVGCVWSIWHIPMWFVVGSSQQKLVFIPFALSCLATSFIMSPIYYKTKSIWLCILLHAIDNACFYIFTFSVDSSCLSGLWVCIVGVLIYYIFNNTIIKTYI